MRLLTRSVRAGGTLVASASDRGSGVDPTTVYIQIDGRDLVVPPFQRGTVRMPIRSLSRGRHRLTLHVSDYQESKNMENSLRILPNTTTLTTTFSVR